MMAGILTKLGLSALDIRSKVLLGLLAGCLISIGALVWRYENALQSVGEATVEVRQLKEGVEVSEGSIKDLESDLENLDKVIAQKDLDRKEQRLYEENSDKELVIKVLEDEDLQRALNVDMSDYVNSLPKLSRASSGDTDQVEGDSQ